MDLTQFKTVEQLAASMRTLLSGLRNFKGISAGSVAPTANDIRATQDIIAGNDITATDQLKGPSSPASADGDAAFDDDVRVEGDLTVVGDIFTVAWTDYSGTTATNGWSSFTTKDVKYKKIGNLVFVKFRIAGESNSTSANFTLPEFNGEDCEGAGKGRDDTGTRIPVWFEFNSSAPGVNVWWDGSATGWTASGTKEVNGHFWYAT